MREIQQYNKAKTYSYIQISIACWWFMYLTLLCQKYQSVFNDSNNLNNKSNLKIVKHLNNDDILPVRDNQNSSVYFTLSHIINNMRKFKMYAIVRNPKTENH